MDSAALRREMESLIAQGAENIDLVTPTHFLPTVLPALTPKLPVPVVYNCGGYESVEALQALEGLVDIYPRTTPTSEWDTAAGECILNEAGGSIRELEHNSTLNYNKPTLINPNFICKSKFLQ
jgi:hypothetical protein